MRVEIAHALYALVSCSKTEGTDEDSRRQCGHTTNDSGMHWSDTLIQLSESTTVHDLSTDDTSRAICG